MRTKKEIAQLFHLSERTVANKVKGIEALIGQRYDSYSVARSGNKLLINEVVFFDYMVNEKSLSDPRLRRWVKDFDYEEAKRYWKGGEDE